MVVVPERRSCDQCSGSCVLELLPAIWCISERVVELAGEVRSIFFAVECVVPVLV